MLANYKIILSPPYLHISEMAAKRMAKIRTEQDIWPMQSDKFFGNVYSILSIIQ